MTAAFALDYLRKVVFDESAIVLPADKNYLLESRLGPVANDAGVEGLDGLANKLRNTRDFGLKIKVVEALTTNETYFFRDSHPFESLRDHVLPEMIDTNRTNKTLRIWCAAASTGQEPYTVAMLLHELLPLISRWSIEFIATDINQTVLDRAKEGIYRQHEVNRGLPAPMLVRYFKRAGTGWQVKPFLSKMIKYQQLNLLEPWPLKGRFDLVLLRNVLIYFNKDTKKDILRRAKHLLKPESALFLGGAESTVGLDQGYVPVKVGRTTYYKLR